MRGWSWVSVPDLEPGDDVAGFGQVAEVRQVGDEVYVWFDDDPDGDDYAAKWDADAMVQVRDADA